ncbi:hypothetical protein [Sporosarcina ureae]|uniref:hypothetical protein n=1 Tax=Sporosarcina ureae TaxID=1571 RepID=UPI0009DC4E6B|nr:hypothetical protein [Sporosarcina ureae]ARF16926.1 hypothetical protein SporoP17a_06330 [Sporosarcina ureae]
MDSLRKRLQQELQQQPDIEIQQSDSWGLPVELINIQYTTIKRTTMDILMKMILLTIQKIEVSESKMIAEFLAVEPLFVENIFLKMQKAQMIELRAGSFMLTKTGVSQLQSGIYEHPPKKREMKFYYSGCHDAILCQQPENVFTTKVKAFRIAKNQTKKVETIDDEKMRTALLSARAEITEGAFQEVINTMEPPQGIETQLIPCVEFYIWNRTENNYFTRVWNTLTEEWDELLEKLIDEQDPLGN